MSFPVFAQPPGAPAAQLFAWEIPLVPGRGSTRLIVLAGNLLRLTTTWCDPAQIWTLDIDDAAGNAVLHGLSLVTGDDLLGQHQHLGLGGALIAQTDHDWAAPPTLANLGMTGHLYFVTAAPQ